MGNLDESVPNSLPKHPRFGAWHLLLTDFGQPMDMRIPVAECVALTGEAEEEG
jgi:hypothetical protein